MARAMKVTPLVRRTPLKRSRRTHTPEERAAHQRYVGARMYVWGRDRGRCQATERVRGLNPLGGRSSLPPGWPSCDGPIDPHHLVLQQQAARAGRLDLLTDTELLVCLCRAHHSWVHSHPALATALGLLRDLEP